MHVTHTFAPNYPRYGAATTRAVRPRRAPGAPLSVASTTDVSSAVRWSPMSPQPLPPHRPVPHPAPPDGPTAPSPNGLTALARLLSGLPPSIGPVRLAAVDGHAGSGKSTFAARLADALGGAPVLRLDDLASHEALFAWTERLTAQVLTPLRRGEPARYGVYDWVDRTYAHTAELPPAPVVLVEGVGAGRRALRPWLAALMWMDMPADAAHARGMGRDGPELTEFWEGWRRAERTHFAEDPSSPHANFLVRECRESYEVREGPQGHP